MITYDYWFLYLMARYLAPVVNPTLGRVLSPGPTRALPRVSSPPIDYETWCSFLRPLLRFASPLQLLVTSHELLERSVPSGAATALPQEPRLTASFVALRPCQAAMPLPQEPRHTASLALPGTHLVSKHPFLRTMEVTSRSRSLGPERHSILVAPYPRSSAPTQSTNHVITGVPHIRATFHPPKGSLTKPGCCIVESDVASAGGATNKLPSIADASAVYKYSYQNFDHASTSGYRPASRAPRTNEGGAYTAEDIREFKPLAPTKEAHTRKGCPRV
jgi:hypothetical protein